VKEKSSLKWFLSVKPQFDGKHLFQKVDFLQRSGKAPLLKEKIRNATLPVAHQLMKQGTGDGICGCCDQVEEEEDISHFLLNCPTLADFRSKLEELTQTQVAIDKRKFIKAVLAGNAPKEVDKILWEMWKTRCDIFYGNSGKDQSLLSQSESPMDNELTQQPDASRLADNFLSSFFDVGTSSTPPIVNNSSSSFQSLNNHSNISFNHLSDLNDESLQTPSVDGLLSL